MKVKIVSDLHLETCEKGVGVPDLGTGDILILGGDILCARYFKTKGELHVIFDKFLKKCVENFTEVLYILGNHEAYGYNYEGTFKVLSEHMPQRIHLLENDCVKIQDWVFLGATLWTDFRNENPLDMMEAGMRMNDYKTIRIGDNYRKLRPEDALKFHIKSKNFLQAKLDQLKNDKVWVLTHHAPSYQSIHSKYRTQTINSAYASDLDGFILENPQIKFWSHGHTHENFDYMIGECRVICNPRGYYPSGVNPNFNSYLEIDI
jgi:Icc-related predicted phosphoesterase